MGMVRWKLLESCRPDFRHVQHMADDFESKLYEDAMYLTERFMLRYWLLSLLEYVKWYSRAEVDYSITALDLLSCLVPLRTCLLGMT
jgi:hypothetical protein